ncbi:MULTISPECIES: tRNA (adenosine(37)-N6)-dimethylallyltransferase MiaA [unclassified Ruminococcus]|uniref:tRNA (adenosine(37)-N6)-dimethylallyltransferase MiaA n=1 Tax=unclassified Ruminococcus TaxID=2608920 RepID=UPI00210AE83A|nr:MULTISPECIES: tRNA (adenosine(37)-N6)-dimethylallyltransferase MiaA [unclassified Ruminococcus]MCQ4023141.1 tRNA (adenosine(37)-N6)-dimethylallyltransferase MiaA [Ruminococcus sp. zg-924]MCQ4115088.1 tRNA (adenosine(37)-N6)-dimethylallyltransferase MiaA [Ruminococcus sp. zg-921]
MNDLQKIPLVAVVGPTASGKTSLGIELAKKYNGEIISADSMQIYKYMDIATAKPTKKEMQGIPHHLIGFCPPDTPFSVADYVAVAKEKILDIHSREKLPIIVGGTGLYISSLLNNIEFSQSSSDENLREELLSVAKAQGADKLLEMLSEFDSESAKRLSEQKNVKRIVRAIEIYKTTGVTMTESIKNSRLSQPPYNDVRIGLKSENRQLLYDRVNKRVDIMLESGLLDETKRIMALNLGKTAKMAIGYKELIPYLEGSMTLDDAIEKLKMETRRYAKRQLTWFRRDEKINWIDIDKLSNGDIIKEACNIVECSRILD